MQRAGGGSTRTIRPRKPSDGCGCKPNGLGDCCATGACGCRKKGTVCSPSCGCARIGGCHNDGRPPPPQPPRPRPAPRVAPTGGKKRRLCELGAACPYQHMHQHQGEFHHGEDDVRPPQGPRPFAGHGHVLGDGGGGAYGGFLPPPTRAAPLPTPAPSAARASAPARSTAPIDLRSDDDDDDALEPPPARAGGDADSDEVEFLGASTAALRAPALAGGAGDGLQLCRVCGKRVPALNFALHKARCLKSRN